MSTEFRVTSAAFGGSCITARSLWLGFQVIAPKPLLSPDLDVIANSQYRAAGMGGLQSCFYSRNGSTRRDGQSAGRANKLTDIYSHHPNPNPPTQEPTYTRVRGCHSIGGGEPHTPARRQGHLNANPPTQPQGDRGMGMGYKKIAYLGTAMMMRKG